MQPKFNLIRNLSKRFIGTVNLDKRQINDAELILNKGYNPLRGFLNQKDYISVLNNKRLTSGKLFPIPIVLRLNEEQINEIKDDNQIILKDLHNNQIAKLNIDDIYKPNMEEEFLSIYGTTDDNHPHIKYLKEENKPYYVG